MATAQAPKRLSQTTVDQLSPTGAKVRLKDHKVSNLYLRMTPAGVKTYAIIYRDPLGAQREMALGSADRITLEMARVRAREELGKLSTGVSPIEQKRESLAEAKARKANTVAGLAERWQTTPAFKRLRPSTQGFYTQCLTTYVMPELGDVPIRDVKRGTVADLLDTVETERSAAVANSARRTLSALMSFAVERDLLEYNPVSGAKAGKRVKRVRDRILTDDELRRLWTAIAERDGMGDTVADMLRFLMLVPARRGEVAGMLWSELDLEAGLWTVPAERMKAGRIHELPLSASAGALLKDRKSRMEAEAKEAKVKLPAWVFPDAAGEGPMDGKRAGKVCGRLAEKWRKQLEEETGEPVERESFGPHDLRRTFTTRATAMAASRGFTVDNIKRCIAHDVYGAEAFSNYDHHMYREEKREILKAWEAELLRIVEGRQPPENVVPMKAASVAK